MTWETVLLREVIELQYGKALKSEARSGNGFPVIGSGGVVGSHDTALVTDPTIVIGRKGSIGSLTFAANGCWPIDTAYFTRLRREVDLRWLYWAMGSLGLDGMNRSAAVPGLNREDAYRTHISLPPLAEQRRIAAILDEADSVRRRQLDAFTAFRRLADRVADERLAAEYAQLVPLGNIATISSGITKGRPAPQGPLTLVPMLTVANVQDKALDLTLVREIEVSEREIDRYRVRPGDLLLTEGGDPDKLGRGVVWNAELDLAIHQNHVFKVRADADVVDSTWLNWEIGSSYGKRYFLRAAKQTTGIATINASQLRAFPVRLVSAASQRAVADIIDAMMTQVHRAERACTSLDALFASLQHRAFRGEL